MSTGPQPASTLVRSALFAGGVVVWMWWWLTVDSELPVHVPVLRWAAALVLFGASMFRYWRRDQPDALTAAVGLFIAAAMLPRALNLDVSPYEVALDEAIHPLLGAEILRNEPWRIFDGISGHFNTPNLDLVLQALLPHLEGARTMSAIFSALSLITTYALASRLYDRRTAAFATIVLGCAYWHVAYARTGYPFMQAILIPTLALLPLVRGLQEDNSFLLFVGGILLGVSGLLYTSGRIVVPVFAAWWLIGACVGWFRWRTILPVALGLIVFLSPLVHRYTIEVFFARFRGATENELAPLGVLHANGWFSDAGWNALAAQWHSAWRVYFEPGGWLAPHSFAPGPLLDIVSFTLALVGLALCVLRLRRPASILLLLWVAATFIGGQLLTDVPQSAYRAAPLLPAVAIAAGVAVESFARAITWLFGTQGKILRIAAALAMLAYLVPANSAALDKFLNDRIKDPIGAIARLVAAGDRRLVYFVLNNEPIVADPRFQVIAGDKKARDVPNLTDLLGRNLAETVPGRTSGAIFILGPSMRTAESVIRRCYPGAIPLGWPQWKGLQPAVGLWLQPQAIAHGRDCELRTSEERGLRAVYYQDDNFKGPVVDTRIEDWQMRWFDDNVPKEYSSIEWRGFLNVPLQGGYTLNLWSNSEGSTAEIGDKIVLGPRQVRNVALAAKIYKVTLRFRIHPWANYALMWKAPGGEIEVIPPELFSPYPRNRSDLRWIE